MSANRSFVENEVIFKKGDKAEGMYIVRRGSVQIYLEKNGVQIPMTVLKEGAIFGEMAFFDSNPRSANVKSLEASELTEITKADFQKLIGQVPKWLVAMMNALSFRLRQTNEKLENMEFKLNSSNKDTVKFENNPSLLVNQKYPYEHAIRAIKILVLSFAKDGEKDGKDTFVKLEFLKNLWNDFSNIDDIFIDKMITALEKCHLVMKKNNIVGQPVVVVHNKGLLTHFATSLKEMAQKLSLSKPEVSSLSIDIVTGLMEYLDVNGEQNMSVNFSQFIPEMQKKGKNYAGWEKEIEFLKIIPKLEIQTTSDDAIFKVNAKEHKIYVNYLTYMKILFEQHAN